MEEKTFFIIAVHTESVRGDLTRLQDFSGLMPTELIYSADQLPWDAPGKRHYDLAFHLDSSWGYSLVPLTVINGTRKPDGEMPPGIAVFGGTHGNEWEGQIAAKRLCHDLDPWQICGRVILMPQLSASACAANTRLSPLDHVNMNRAFPGNPRGSISYRIAHFVKSSVFPHVHIVADLTPVLGWRKKSRC